MSEARPIAWTYRYNGVRYFCESEEFAKHGIDPQPLFTRPAAPPAPVGEVDTLMERLLSDDPPRNWDGKEAADALTALSARLAECEAREATALKTTMTIQDAAYEYKARAEALEKALNKYGKHDGLCGIVGGYGYCTCGFDDARAALTTGGE